MKVGKVMVETAIVNANTYDSESGLFLKKTIIVKDEKIHALLPTNESFQQGNVIDGTNLYVTPGLIDTCSQIGLKEKGIRWEGNDSYEPEEINHHSLRVIDGIYPFDTALQDAVASGVTTAHIVSSGENVIGAQTAVIHTNGKTVDEMVLKEKLGYSYSMGDIPKQAFWAKTNMPLTRMGIANHIRQSLIFLRNEGDLKNTPIFIRAHRADDIATAHRIAKEFSLNFVLVHTTEYGKLKNSSLQHPETVIAGPCFQPIERYELKSLNPSLYSILADKQIAITFATDHPTSSVSHLQLEGSLALKAGLDEKTILNGLTKHAAQLLKIDHLTGDIQEGLYADLVLWNDHPLNLTAKAVSTFIKGKEVYREVESHA